MRIRHDKIRDLSQQVLELLRDHRQIELLAPEDAIRVAVGGVILDDLEEEDEIDREVDALMLKHASDIESQDLDATSLRQKFKHEIAKRRGFTL